MILGPLHTRIYYQFFDLDDMDDVYCELCQRPAVDIHHIDARGMGGSRKADEIKNLMAVCRRCHDEYGDRKKHKDYLKKIHIGRMIQHLQKIIIRWK